MIKNIYLLFIIYLGSFLDLNANYPYFLKNNLICKKMDIFDMRAILVLLQNNSDICLNTGINTKNCYKTFMFPGGNRIEGFVCKSLDNHNFVGFLSGEVKQQSNKFFYIRFLGVDVHYRRSGIATALLHVSYDFAKNNNCEELVIHPADNASELCYQKFGFTKDSKKKSFLMYRKID